MKAICHSIAQRMCFYSNLVHSLLAPDDYYNLQQASVMLTCHDDNRGYIFEGKKYSHLLDSINERLSLAGVDTVTVSLPFSSKSVTNFGRVFSVNRLIARAILLDKLFKLFGIRLVPNDNKKVKAWALIISRVKPQIVIGIQPPVELCIAAKSLGIPVYDLQHGVISGEGYYGAACRECFNQEGWPTCILCWNQASVTWIESKIGHLTTSKLIGNPWFLRFIWPSKEDRLVTVAQEIINKIGSSNRKKILVTLQWGLDQCPNHHKTGMPVGLIRCIKETSVSFDWWIRVHPVMLQGNRRAATFSMLKKEFTSYENVYWEYCTDMPLPIVLAQTDLHITVSSATTIEAGWFGIRTALLSADYEYLLNWFSEELSSEIAEFVLPQCDAIRRWVERCLLLSKEPVNTFMSIQPLDNFIKEIQVTCLRSP